MEASLKYLRVVIAAGYLCGIALSPRLWFNIKRTFPHAPISVEIPGFLFRHDSFLSLTLVVALILLLLGWRPRIVSSAIVLLTTALVLLDQTRLQPWVYQYGLLLLLLTRVRKPKAGSIIAACQLLVALLYSWSGLQKMNWTFVNEVVPSLCADVHLHLPVQLLLPVGLICALIEVLIGLGLLINRTRTIAFWSAIAMHLVILLTLIAGQRNSVVWPWNLSLIAIVVVLFWKYNGPTIRYSFELIAVGLVCGILPGLSFAGWWDLNLSAALYSGRTSIAVMHITEPMQQKLSPETQQKVFSTGRGEVMLPLFEWSMGELNVPPYPATRAATSIGGQLCLLTEDPTATELIIRSQPAIFDGKYTVTRISCLNLLEKTN